MTHLGFEHNGKFCGVLNEYPILDYEHSNSQVDITICNAKRFFDTNLFFELEPPLMYLEIVIKTKKPIYLHILVRNIDKVTKEEFKQYLLKKINYYSKKYK